MKTTTKTRRNYCISGVLTLYLYATIITVGGCETRAQTGTLAGAGIGALAGQAIGASTGATLIGAGIGAGAGYLIGNSQDKKAAKTYDMSQPTPLTGTSWKVVNLVKKDMPEYESIIVEFKPNGEVVTTINEPGGTMTVTEERYRIVGNDLIVNKPGYIINATYKVKGNQLTIDCEQFKAVLERVK